MHLVTLEYRRTRKFWLRIGIEQPVKYCPCVFCYILVSVRNLNNSGQLSYQLQAGYQHIESRLFDCQEPHHETVYIPRVSNVFLST